MTKVAIGFFIIVLILAAIAKPDVDTDDIVKAAANIVPLPVSQVEDIEIVKIGTRVGLGVGLIIFIIVAMKGLFKDVGGAIVSNIKNDSQCSRNLFNIIVMAGICIILVAAGISFAGKTDSRVVAESPLPQPTTVIEIFVEGTRVK